MTLQHFLIYCIYIKIIILIKIYITKCEYFGNECAQDCPPTFSRSAMPGSNTDEHTNKWAQILRDINPLLEEMAPRCIGNYFDFMYVSGATKGIEINQSYFGTDDLQESYEIAKKTHAVCWSYVDFFTL